MQKQDIIRRYFKAWIDSNIETIKQTFTDDVVYTECYGPEYHGLPQILKWFTEWNKNGKVLEWTIKRTIEQNNTLVVEWYFKCSMDGNVDGFDGVTIADFDDSMRIKRLSEFQSKAEHYYPYGERNV